MDLIAIRDFAKTPMFNSIAVKGEKHPRHIHKGARITLGDFAPEEINKLPITPEKQIAAALLFHRCARHATPENVAAVEAELAVDRRREENAAKRDLLAQATVIAQLQRLRLAS